jgi:hypothetical protein
LASSPEETVQLDDANIRAEIGGAHRAVEPAAGHSSAIHYGRGQLDRNIGQILEGGGACHRPWTVTTLRRRSLSVVEGRPDFSGSGSRPLTIDLDQSYKAREHRCAPAIGGILRHRPSPRSKP